MSDVKIEEEQKPEVPVEASEATATGDAADDNNDEVCTPAYPRDFDSWLPTGFRPPSMRARGIACGSGLGPLSLYITWIICTVQ